MNRDGYCLHCGETEAISPNHRINRGMGGSKSLDKTSNLVVLCSRLNGLIESDAFYRDMALRHGWKLERWQTPEETPVFDECTGIWYLLNNTYDRIVVEQEKEIDYEWNPQAL